ncbi:type I DNA topoisomerase [Carboxylicivirga sp. N1Y90]|uniref:type I DNA topoisomerase n=1 Tax=Carboxylicivirga fragile TaxID=3417571 RepID=UPI003D324D7E|nr:type I DNA topoisomerase [Marinilabiliaceae bacterium N1Y90]
MGKKTTVKEGNLVIVESPAKAKTIEKFLGEDFVVKSSYGHIRDLSKTDFGVDKENNYEPDYIISKDKKEVVKELKSLAKKSKMVWLASDEDREGEAIAWHLYEVLGLKEENTRRIVFHEITKEAIQNAVKNPRSIDYNLVNAQQARRILDRLVGFELSPVLWRKVKPSLSAGRVQSVAVRVLVDREREIFAFKPTSSYRVTALFEVKDEKGKVTELKAELSKRFDTLEETKVFLEQCTDAAFNVNKVEKKPVKKSPAAPFTTSTLQQEASRKLGYSVSQTMSVAQKLYEAGKITYMRTDSVNLSDMALSMASNMITEKMGEQYVKIRKYKTKAKGAQEAHEAIRPTYLNNESVSGSSQEQKLYELIWKRTIASQMSDAQLEKTVIHINAGTTGEKFMATGEIIKFDGFLKVYIESTDAEGEQDDDKGGVLLPPMSEGDVLDMLHIDARQRWSLKPPRYTEASLVRKLEELGIGRPSTYAPTISTIQNRGYVVKEEREGVERVYKHLMLVNGGSVEVSDKKEISGAERNKLFPTDIGMVVNDFLVKYFDNIVSFDFTAKVEKDFDEIALGNVAWNKSIDEFYKPFHLKVEETLENSEKSSGERILGEDPATGKPVSVRIGRFGPLAQIGESSEDEEDKPKFASLRKGQHLETITLEEALDLFKLPRTVGEFENKVVVIGIGRFGPYIRHDGKFVSLKKDVDDPMEIDLETSIERIKTKREEDAKKLIKEFPEDEELRILIGRWGPFIKHGKNNIKIPKDKVAEDLTFEECMALVEASPVKKGKAAAKKTTAKKATAKKTTAKKTAAKKTTAKKSTAKKKTSTAKTKKKD